MPHNSRSDWLAGRYEKLDRLDRGGMAVVWLAADHGEKPWSDDRQVALKILKPEYADDESQLRRFEQEGEAMTGFDHRNIVTAYEQGNEGGIHFLVMEYIDGISVGRLIERRTSPLPVADAVAILTQVCAGIEYSHGQGVIHRDIKPANVMLVGGYAAGTTPKVKVTDFGIARARGSTRLTQTGGFIGTPVFMAPEIMLGREATECSDVYACGAMLYQLLTGTVPFAGDFGEIVDQHRRGLPPPAPQSLNGLVPRLLSEATMAALEIDPANRYDNPAAMRGAIEAAESGRDFGDFLPTRMIGSHPDRRRRKRQKETAATAVRPRPRGHDPIPAYGPREPGLALIWFFGTVAALSLLLLIALRLSSVIASMPLDWFLGGIGLLAVGTGVLFSPLASTDLSKRTDARDQFKSFLRHSGRRLVVAALAAYWAILGYHLADVLKDRIGRQPGPSHVWLEVGSIAIWLLAAVIPLRTLYRSQMRVGRLMAMGVVVAFAWTIGAEGLAEAPGKVAPLIWSRASLQHRVSAEGKRWIAMLGAPDARLDQAERRLLRRQLARNRNEVLRALRHADPGRPTEHARRRALRWLHSLRHVRHLWRHGHCAGRHLSIDSGGAHAVC